MSKSFASLLRNSRLASYDRSISQVYTAPAKYKQVGDWGLKRTLPTVIRTKYATFEALDTQEHQTPWKAANNQVLFVKRWKENFPKSEKPVPRTDVETHNIAKMTPGDFQRFLQQCARLEPEFQQLLKKKELVPEQVFEFLQVTFADNPSDVPVGPTYSSYTPDQSYPVEGRILNGRKHGHAVGVGGVVAFLPKRHSINLRHLGDKKVRTFYVESAYIDDEGKPRVVLTTKPAESDSAPFTLSFDGLYDDTPTIHTRDLFLTRSDSLGIIQDDDDRVQANPDHDELMSRIADLIHKK